MGVARGRRSSGGAAMADETLRADAVDPPAPNSSPAVSPDAVAAALVGVVVGVLALPVYWRLVTVPGATALGINDFAVHLELAEQFGLRPPKITAPHPVFYLLVATMRSITGVSAAATLACAGATGAAAAVLVLLGRRRDESGRRLALAPSVAFAAYIIVAESPNPALQAIGLIPPNRTLPTTHSWGSPTETVMLPFLLLLLLVLLDLFEQDELSPPRQRWLLLLAVLTTLAKPTFTVALVPGLPLALVLSGRWSRERASAAARMVLAPILVVMAWQYWFVASGQLQVATVGLEVAPLEVAREVGLLDAGPAFWIAPSIVLLAAVVGRSRYFRDTGTIISWCCLAIAMLPLLVLRETGASNAHANVTKSAWICWFVLNLFTVRFLALEATTWWRSRSRARPPAWALIASAFAVLSVLVGIVTYLEHAGLIVSPA